MGFIARLFGVYTPEEHLERARRYLDANEPNEARLELEGVDASGADELRQEALEALVELNLDEARARYGSGDEDAGREHIEMAKTFGATPERLRQLRREIRELRSERRRKEEEEARKAEVITPEGDDPLWSLPPSDPRVRFAMLVEAYPPDLRERLAALGKEFAEAVLMLEDGKPAEAWQALSRFVEQEPAVRFERARAALATDQPAKAASDLEHFGAALGHQRIGGQHTAVTLAQLHARLGRLDRALELCEAELPSGDLSVAATYAHILEALNRLEEAERATTTVLAQAAGDLGLYRLLGRIRIRRGDRLGAMQALEGGMRVGKCETPGKCGYKPPDVPSLRMLAQLYLEDRIEPKRAKEVVDLLFRMVQQPSWDDAYIQALVARNDGDPGARDMARALTQSLRPDDPRVTKVQEQFALQLAG